MHVPGVQIVFPLPSLVQLVGSDEYMKAAPNGRPRLVK